MAAKTTRTLNPLHFEDLEPHRFEDLVRQLAYDFRPWRSIEATGRLGSDEGIDIRATEVLGQELGPGGEEAEEEAAPAGETRLWVIQCKREKKLGPADVLKIVKDALPGGGDSPYGFILSAACDFSKKARDTLHQEAAKRGVRETHVWGKAELEDMLFQPRNDHLLFAYFNISLQVRRRSLRTELRSRLAVKRKLISVLGDVRQDHKLISAFGAVQQGRKVVLLRDPREERYPYEQEIADFDTFPRWKHYTFWSHYPPDNLMFVVSKHFAYVDDSGEGWDAMFGFNDENPVPPGPREIQKFGQDQWAKREPYWAAWDKVPRQNQAWFYRVRFVHYDRILAVDEFGDSIHDGPHLLVEFDRECGPFDSRMAEFIDTNLRFLEKEIRLSPESRIAYFPEELRSVPIDEDSADNSE